MKLHAPAAQRNAGPILEVLRAELPARGRVLEIASGTGQHVATFAAALPDLTFLPTEFDASKLESIGGWTAGLDNVAAPMVLDVTQASWSLPAVDAVLCANMIHIAPPEAMHGLLAGVGRHLVAGGVFALYGPFMIEGRHTAPSNAQFDASLRARDPRWGVRAREDVESLAAAQGLTLQRSVPMPANNYTLVFRREAGGSSPG